MMENPKDYGSFKHSYLEKLIELCKTDIKKKQQEYRKLG